MTLLNIKPISPRDLPKEVGNSRAWVAEHRGNKVAVFGIESALCGCIVFSYMLEEGLPKKFIYRAGKEIMEFLKGLGYKNLCAVTTKESLKFLQRLGWEHCSSQRVGEVVTWEQPHYR